MNVVEIQNGYKYYGSAKNKIVALDNLNVTIKSGIIYGLLGASGCGKTTLLSCIVGIEKLNGGNIKVLGGSPEDNKKSVTAMRIGYMPQEVALLQEFTFKETLFFFGRIYGMDAKDIVSRYCFLRDLFELPNSKKYIKQLSLGQQRCVSFASSMVHEPELLILDEPTVGLDPLLREKMWEYLSNISKSQNRTVIITTHYIEEARQADYVGMMRNGTLLIEKPPTEIMSQMDVNSLEEAFYHLSLEQSRSNCSTNSVEESFHSIHEVSISEEKVSKTENSRIIKKPTTLKKSYQTSRKMLALFRKSVFSFTRQPVGFCAILYFPIMVILLIHFGLGGNFEGIKMGMVNEEVLNYKDCLNSSFVTTSLHECNFSNVSCQLISSIDRTSITKIFYSSYDQAFTDAISGKINGFIHIKAGFSAFLSQISSTKSNVNNKSTDTTKIIVLHDRLNYPISMFIQKELSEDYQKFIKSLLSNCSLSEKLGDTIFNFQKPIYGKTDSPFKNHVMYGSISLLAFYFALLCTCTVFINERLDGVWNRTLIAGASTNDILLANISCQFIVVLIQCTEISVLVLYFLKMENNGSDFIIFAILLANGICGMFCGVFVTMYSKSNNEATFVGTGLFFLIVILSGSIWPLEGVHKYLQYIAYILPSSLSSDAVKAVMIRGWGLKYFKVWFTFLDSIIWTFIFIVLSIIKFKKIV